MALRFKVEGKDEVVRDIRKVFNKLHDLRPLFESLASDFYKTEKNMIFRSGQNVNGPGKYEDLRPRTKVLKMQSIGRIYPILDWTGRLKKSLSDRGSKDNITTITKRKMTLGTKVPYAKNLFRGTKRMVARPPIIMELLEPRFTRTINTYFSDVVK